MANDLLTVDGGHIVTKPDTCERVKNDYHTVLTVCSPRTAELAQPTRAVDATVVPTQTGAIGDRTEGLVVGQSQVSTAGDDSDGADIQSNCAAARIGYLMTGDGTSPVIDKSH